MPISFSITDLNTNSIANFMQRLLFLAIERNVSDIHFESQSNSMKIRFRIDGILYDVCNPPKPIAPMIISYLKIKANLDIAEKRLPQDGRYAITPAPEKKYICRLSTLPTLYGEKAVLRLLYVNTHLLTIENLGFESWQKTIFLKHIQKPQGLILITGPTGSGKTTTLYTALALLNTSKKNISTIEDPIEIELENINQLNINPKIGLTFSHALRALLRQDPDIIMIGEIRDGETAMMAIHAAQTGHLVFATLHTNNAVESLTRLTMLGITAIDLVETLKLIIAQRLIRKLCSHCKAPIILTTSVSRQWGLTDQASLFQENACEHCLQGFNGRTGVYQFFQPDNSIKIKMLQGIRPYELARQCKLTSLWDMGLAKVHAGITSLNELQRAIGQE